MKGFENYRSKVIRDYQEEENMAKKIKFLPTKDEREKAVRKQAIAISHWADWDVNLIIDVFLEALVDVNAHDLKIKIEEVIDS